MHFRRYSANHASFRHKQLLHMIFDTLGEGHRVVTSLQSAYDPSVSVRISYVQYRPSHRGKIFTFQSERADRIKPVRVETRRDENQLRPNLVSKGSQCSLELLKIFSPRYAEGDRHIQRRSQAGTSANLVGSSGARIKRIAVDREEAHTSVFPENLLRAVSVMNVPIDDEHAIQTVLIDRSARRGPHC
jgi:hypothetical protein